MNAPNTAHTPDTPNTPAGLVWDLPVRVFHWTLALCFAGAWLTAESEYWKLWHVSFGYSMALLVAFRLVWGVVGTRYARFSQFVKGPAALKKYFLSYLRGAPEHHTGHNPAGAWAILAILLTVMLTVASGYASYQEIGGEILSDIHEAMASILMGIVVIHLAAVILTSVLQRENLVRAMLTGKKHLASGETIQRSRSLLPGLIALLLLVAVAGIWWRMFG